MEKKNKICFVSLYAYHFFNPENQSIFGGSEYQMFLMAKEIAKVPLFNVSFVVADFGQKAVEVYEQIRLYKSINPKNLFTKIFGILFVLPRTLQRIIADIYLQKAAGLEVGITALFCKLRRKKFIYLTANDEDVRNRKPSWMSGGILGTIRWQLFRWGVKNANLIIVQHEKQREDLKKYYGKDSTVRFSAQYIPEERVIDLNKKKIILWVGKANKKTKQPEVFIELARQFPAERFVMICPFSGNRVYFEEIKKIAGAVKNLKFIEGVFFNQIEDYFLKAKIFVNTSVTEGFPNTFIQAVKYKTPIISLIVNPDRVLEKYKIGLSAQGLLKNLSKFLAKLLINKEVWLKLGENGYKYAKEYHNIKKIIKEDKKVILELSNINSKTY